MFDLKTGKRTSALTPKYYVVGIENRKVLFGPFESREAADNAHYEVCCNGIPDNETGIAARPRCAVVSEHALTPNDQGNHFAEVREGK